MLSEYQKFLKKEQKKLDKSIAKIDNKVKALKELKQEKEDIIRLLESIGAPVPISITIKNQSSGYNIYLKGTNDIHHALNVFLNLCNSIKSVKNCLTYNGISGGTCFLECDGFDQKYDSFHPIKIWTNAYPPRIERCEYTFSFMLNGYLNSKLYYFNMSVNCTHDVNKQYFVDYYNYMLFDDPDKPNAVPIRIALGL